MLFTWDTTNLCIIFESWHIRSTAGLIFSLLSIVLIGMGYEALRAGTRQYELLVNRRVVAAPSEFTCAYIQFQNLVECFGSVGGEGGGCDLLLLSRSILLHPIVWNDCPPPMSQNIYTRPLRLAKKES